LGIKKCLVWVVKSKGVQYLDLQMGFTFPREVNFDKLFLNLKEKLVF
jgi:hypothetical protein